MHNTMNPWLLEKNPYSDVILAAFSFIYSDL